MKTLHSPEAILFYEKVIEFKSYETKCSSQNEQQTKLAKYIVDHFIATGSPHEIKIGKRERNQVIERVKQFTGHLNEFELESMPSNSKQTLKQAITEMRSEECSESTSTQPPIMKRVSAR